LLVFGVTVTATDDPPLISVGTTTACLPTPENIDSITTSHPVKVLPSAHVNAVTSALSVNQKFLFTGVAAVPPLIRVPPVGFLSTCTSVSEVLVPPVVFHSK
jgi:hypothetical protein